MKAAPQAPKEEVKPVPFSGVARSVQCFKHNGWCKDFRIVTMTIKDGIVTEVQYSDPYASWDCISRMELAMELGIINLNVNWEEGATLSRKELR